MTTTATLPSVADPTANQASPRGQTLTLTPTPWAQVVRGGESPESSSPPPPLSPEKAGESSEKVGNDNVGKKPVWIKPLNGVTSGDHAVNGNGNGNAGSAGGGGGVIGGFASWPALSESTRPGFKPSVADSVKSTVDGSVPAILNKMEPARGGSNSNHSTGGHNVGPARPRTARRGGGGGGNRQGSFSRSSTAPRAPTFPVPEVKSSGFGNVAPSVSAPDSSSRDSRPNDHTNHRGSNRRGNYGQQQNRGDGRNNYRSGRRDQDRGNHEWNSSQAQHPIDAHGHPHLPQTMGFGRPYLQVAPPFPILPPFGPYGNAMAYPDMPPVIYYPFPSDSFTGVPSFPAPPPPPYVAMAEPPLHVSIVRQIDYYFSDANLVKDEYLRKNMDGRHGWVDIGLIASFPRVQNLTTNIPLILQCLNRLSLVIEVQGDKVRRRDDWKKWLTPNQSPLASGAAQDTADTTEDTLSRSLQNTSLQEVNHDQTPNELTKGSQVENKENQE